MIETLVKCYLPDVSEDGDCVPLCKCGSHKFCFLSPELLYSACMNSPLRNICRALDTFSLLIARKWRVTLLWL